MYIIQLHCMEAKHSSTGLEFTEMSSAGIETVILMHAPS